MHLFIIFRLALYVYEYLLHVGAQKSAQTFLSEVSGPSLLCVGKTLCVFLKFVYVCRSHAMFNLLPT